MRPKEPAVRPYGAVSASMAFLAVRTPSQAHSLADRQSGQLKADIMRRISADGLTFSHWDEPVLFFDPGHRAYCLTETARVEWDAAWERQCPPLACHPWGD